MTISEHVNRTKKLIGVPGEDIHLWIDQFFDYESFNRYIRTGRSPAWFNPYDHRTFRHCREALDEAYREFGGKYKRAEIRAVFETHLKDDYGGYIPRREDFTKGTFREKYHEQHRVETSREILSSKELSDYFSGSSYLKRKEVLESRASRYRLGVVFPTVAAITLFIAAIFIVILPFFRSSMLESKREMIHEMVYEVEGVINYYIEQEQSNFLSREEAQSRAVSVIRGIRYGESGKDYFWITDMFPRMIMHPYRMDLEGEDLTDYKDKEDKSGKNLFVEAKHLVEKNGEGYLRYLWQWMDDPTQSVYKLSFVKGIKDWNWIVGTGVYLNDIEEETNSLLEKILIAFGIITVILIGLLMTILLQSKKIEEKKERAEAGLREAKDRYRALVEASKEGYLLEMEEEVVYSNPMLRQMLDYSEEEIASMKPWEILDPDSEENEIVIGHIQRVTRDEEKPGEFIGLLRTKRGNVFRATITTDRMFFSRTGHIFTIRPVVSRKEINTIGGPDFSSSLSSLKEKILGSETIGYIIENLNQLHSLISSLLEQGTKASVLRELIGTLFDSAIVRCIEISLLELGEPPVPFAFFTLGSNARHEMTLFSDQDNGLVFQTPPGGKEEMARVRNFFLKLSYLVNSKLDSAGYHYCTGGIMASNPKWCLSSEEWILQFQEWIKKPDNRGMMGFHVFYDLRTVYGDSKITEQMFSSILEMVRKTPAFFTAFVNNGLTYRVPTTIFGKIKGHKQGGVETLNIKECIKPIETFIRIYALHNEIRIPGTEERIAMLFERDVIDEFARGNILFCFNYLWDLRFRNQMTAHANLQKRKDELVLAALTGVERQILKNILTEVSDFRSKVSFDFLGNPLY